jgi:hypothetical protein
MDLDPRHILELVGLDTIVAAFIVGALVSTIYLKTRKGAIGLGLIERSRME